MAKSMTAADIMATVAKLDDKAQETYFGQNHDYKKPLHVEDNRYQSWCMKQIIDQVYNVLNGDVDRVEQFIKSAKFASSQWWDNENGEKDFQAVIKKLTTNANKKASPNVITTTDQIIARSGQIEASDVLKWRKKTNYPIRLVIGDTGTKWSYNPLDYPIHAWTQMGLAETMADILKGHAFYDSNRGVWFAWSGRYWTKIPASNTSEMYQTASTLPLILLKLKALEVNPIGDATMSDKDFCRFVRSSASKATLSAVFSLAQQASLLGRSNIDWNNQRNTINLLNGEYQIAQVDDQGRIAKGDRKLHKHDKKHMFTNIYPVKYNPDAKAPKFVGFIKSLTHGDEDMEKYLQLMAGYALLGSNDFEHLFVLQGPARSGKSTFLHIISSIGEVRSDEEVSNSVSGIPFTIFTKSGKSSGEGNTPVRARLADKRMVVTDEPDRRTTFSEGLVKSLTGRDRITAQRKYEKPFSFDPYFKLFVGTNYAPQSSGDDAIMRRLILVKFDRAISSNSIVYDPNLEDEILTTEKEGVLLWMLKGAERLVDLAVQQRELVAKVRQQVKSGKISQDKAPSVEQDPFVLTMPAKVKEWCLAYKSEANTAGQFLKDSLMSKAEYWNYLTTSTALNLDVYFNGKFINDKLVGDLNHNQRFNDDQKLVADAEGSVLVKDLYQMYRDIYCKNAGIDHPLTQRNFNQTVGQYFPKARLHNGISWLGVAISPTYSYGQYHSFNYGKAIDRIRWMLDNRKHVWQVEDKSLDSLIKELKVNNPLSETQLKKVKQFIKDNNIAYLNKNDDVTEIIDPREEGRKLVPVDTPQQAFNKMFDPSSEASKVAALFK